MAQKPYKNRQKQDFRPQKHWGEDASPSSSLPMPRKKKALGQNFLRKQSVVDHMIEAVTITPEHGVLEIGCGDGFLTRAILGQTRCKVLRCYEIDPDWADYVGQQVKDPRLELVLKNILEVDLAAELGNNNWVVLANLPYNITFPILFAIQKNKQLFTQGVVMVQEEVAQKIAATRGKGYNPTSLFLQHHFTWRLLEKIEPGAFVPPPKVFSRLLHFVPRTDSPAICHEDLFWKFVHACFRSPRQTLRNNLRTTHYITTATLPDELLSLRAQQLEFDQLHQVWNTLIHTECTK